MKIIFVTGGVVSGLGKGITAASIGRIIKDAGYKVSMVKMDPYLQVDAGTMSPYEHGEVFVTDDGAETDLDIGNYERFTNENSSGDNNITTGKVYLTVINKERAGDYLGKTVQVIPHITDEIKHRITRIAKKSDVCIVEVGGTIGDIESLPFFEAIRQMKKDIGKNNVLYVHVAPLLYMRHSGEYKTKPIQHTVKALREVGIIADILVCRTEQEVDKKSLEKISLHADVDKQNIIQAVNVDSIYQIPLHFVKQGVDKILNKELGLDFSNLDMKNWKNKVNKIISPKKEVTISVIGKYAQLKDCYLSMIEAFVHAGANNDCAVNLNWVQAEDLEVKDFKKIMKDLQKQGKLDGIIVPGGFGDRGVEGKINAINYIRENDVPFLGICLGLQTAVIEYSRNVCGLKDANSTEFDENTKHPVVDFMPEQRGLTQKGGTMRLGAYDAVLQKGTLAYNLYKEEKISERHRHRFEVNPDYHDILKEKGLTISGMSPNKRLVEFIELSNHPYFIATQAHPEFKSRLDQPHPLFDGLVKAAISKKSK